MKNILVVTNESSHGGAEKMLSWVANSLAKDGSYNVVFCNLDTKDPYYPLDERVEIVKLDKPLKENFVYRNTIGFIKKTRFLSKLIKEKKIDVAVNFNDHAFYNLLVCKMTTKVKLLLSNRIDPEYITSFTGKLRLKLLKYADGLVCQTQSALDFFDEKLKQRSTVINNPVYELPEEPWQAELTEDTIINVARLEIRQKRQDVLLKAFVPVHEQYPQLKLKLFGSALEQDKIRVYEMIEELGLQDCVQYGGISQDIMTEMRKAKLMVLSSDFEGIPNAVLEGMALGMPIVSTDCRPGGARLLLEEDYGVLVPIGDDKALAKGMLDLLDHYDRAVELGKRARGSMDRFSENKIGAQWKEYLERIS